MKKLLSILSITLFVCVLSSHTVEAPEPWIYDTETGEFYRGGGDDILWVCGAEGPCEPIPLSN